MGILEGKKALVFGAASNLSIAYGIATQLKAEGADVALSYAAVHEKRVKPIAEELGAEFVEECDLSSDEAIDNLVNKYEAKYGKIDIVYGCKASVFFCNIFNLNHEFFLLIFCSVLILPFSFWFV